MSTAVWILARLRLPVSLSTSPWSSLVAERLHVALDVDHGAEPAMARAVRRGQAREQVAVVQLDRCLPGERRPGCKGSACWSGRCSPLDRPVTQRQARGDAGQGVVRARGRGAAPLGHGGSGPAAVGQALRAPPRTSRCEAAGRVGGGERREAQLEGVGLITDRAGALLAANSVDSPGTPVRPPEIPNAFAPRRRAARAVNDRAGVEAGGQVDELEQAEVGLGRRCWRRQRSGRRRR